LPHAGAEIYACHACRGHFVVHDGRAVARSTEANSQNPAGNMENISPTEAH
jgi:hypothetical protein